MRLKNALPAWFLARVCSELESYPAKPGIHALGVERLAKVVEPRAKAQA